MSNAEYVIDLKIDLKIGGKNAEVVVGMYEANIVDDIIQTAWNLCDCDDQMQSKRFGSPEIISYDIRLFDDRDSQVNVIFRVTGDEPEFIEKVISEYMDGFADRIDVTRNGYYSRTGSRVGTDIEIKNWNLAINHA